MGEDEGELTQTGVVLGSPKYMSPEQLFGAGSVDSRTDIWSIGAILYELIAGRPPYDQPSLARICADLAGNKPPPRLRDQRTEVTPELETVVLHCLERSVDLRIQSVAELAGDLLAAVGSPYSEQVRTRIRQTLDPAGTSAANSSLRQPGGSTGTYTSLAFADASASYPKAGGNTEPTAGATLLSSQDPARKRRQGMIAVALLAIAGVGGWLFLNRERPAPEDGSAAAAPSVPATATPVPAAAAVATAPAPTETGQPANGTKAPAPSEPVRHVSPPSRPVVTRPAPQPRTTPAPSPENPPPSTATPSPPSTTADQPRKKLNPLEDRQ
jgi:serine/threonine-protein kinase